MNKWIETLMLDATRREDEITLTPKEKQMYTGGMAIAFAVAAAVNLLAGYPYAWLVSIGLLAVAARKLQIWLHKREKLKSQK